VVPVLGVILLVEGKGRADDGDLTSQSAHQPIVEKPGEQVESEPRAPKPDLEGKVTDSTPLAPWDDKNPDEANAYYHTLILAHTTSAQTFARSARKDVAYVHLFEEPAKYRGEVIHFEGRRLKKIRPLTVPKDIKEAFDLPESYEAWMFAPEYGANPICVVFTELPKGVSVGEDMEVPVAFDGYFFKKYRYKAGDGWRDAPLLIGHTIRVDKSDSDKTRDETSSFSKLMLMGFLGLLVLTGCLAIALNLWYRHDDKRIRSILADANPVILPEPAEAGESRDDLNLGSNGGDRNDYAH
jgi:hypothetical protein